MKDQDSGGNVNIAGEHGGSGGNVHIAGQMEDQEAMYT
jgi:hypothetical protein